MKCQQCNNNALYQVGSEQVPLCLNCFALMQQTTDRIDEALKEEKNYLHDSIDYTIFGFRAGPRYPTKRPVLLSGGTVNHNHIAINNSQVGVLNTGNIKNLNQTIDSLYAASQKELAENIRKFSNAILADENLTDDQKTQVLESLDFITKELFQKSENRKRTIVSTLFGVISKAVELTANTLVVWQALYPMLQKFFS
jgi:hypothetical protein